MSLLLYFLLLLLLSPAGGALPSGPGPVGGAQQLPARSRDAAHSRAHRCCWSRSDRRAHLGGTRHVEDQRRGEDRPVRVRRDLQTVGNHDLTESLRGRQDLKSFSLSLWVLFFSRSLTVYLPPVLIRTIRIQT